MDRVSPISLNRWGRRCSISFHAGKLIEALIKKGADPMSHDQAFLGFCKSKKNYVREEFVLCMVSEMCKKEVITGKRFQDANGRNPLQVLVSNNVYGASLTFVYLWDASVSNTMKQWLSERDPKGNTALHLLWDDNGIVDRTLNKDVSGVELEPLSRAAWRLQETVESAPGYNRMWDKNNAGVSVYELISKRVAQGLPLDESCEIAKWVNSQRQADQMQQSAAQYAPSSRIVRRI